MELASIRDAAQWNDQIKNLPGAHALQTWEWGQVKSRFGWQPHPLLWRGETGQVNAAALLLQRKLSIASLTLPLGVMYVPRGPLLEWSDPDLVKEVLDDLQSMARAKKAIFLKIDPDLPVGTGIPGEAEAEDDQIGRSIQDLLRHQGWIISDEQIQFRNTVEVDLTGDEDILLMRMKSKTRYNIRLAERRGVTIRPGSTEDINLLYHMYAHTALRDDFTIRSKAYYQAVWETFFKGGLAEPLIAEVEGQPVGGAVIFRFARRAWYMHGMSLDEHREKMFNYRLQWEGMLRSKAAGCHTYDMWGAPDSFTEDDPLWGVYRFKDGFGGRVVRTLGAWDYLVRPMVFRGYTQVLPRVLEIMRSRGKSDTKRSLST
jgi:lipid II:glycine glycyltransferase (peptidoglycan interpeptide bridge formation enzyme)